MPGEIKALLYSWTSCLPGDKLKFLVNLSDFFDGLNRYDRGETLSGMRHINATGKYKTKTKAISNTK